MSQEYPVRQRVLARFDKAQDLETHVRLVEIDTITSLAISDYIISLDEYGRSYWLPRDPASLKLVAQALSNITEDTKV